LTHGRAAALAIIQQTCLILKIMRRPSGVQPPTYWIERPEQIRAMSSPIRHEIGDRLAALGPVTVKDLADALGKKPTAIYHHLRQLEAVGLVKATRQAGERGRPAVVYATIAPRMRLARAPRKAVNRGPMARAGIAAATQAGRDYAQGFAQLHWAIEGAGRNHWFFRVSTAPSPARLERINRLLDELAELVWTPDPHPGPPMSIAWFLSPVRGARKGKKS
jgi:DNA-binding transcriptional ArsR family regulator